jgi:hypothetical protein
MSMKKQVQVGFREAEGGGPARLEIAVPEGTTRADLGGVLQRVIPNIEKLRPRGCLACLSGLDINIRERFENVLTLDL